MMVMVVMVKLICSYFRKRHDGKGADNHHDTDDHRGRADHLIKKMLIKLVNNTN